jgi:hypothetical protein
MKIVALLSLLIVAAALMGCTTDPCDPCGVCGNLNGNCCGWEFYKPCHPIAGRAGCDEVDPCGTRIVLKGCGSSVAAPAAEVIEDEPTVEAVPDDAPEVEPDPANDPVADYGQPPAIR